MSAFILGDDTIDLLVTAGVRGVGLDARLAVYHGDKMHYWSRYEDTDSLGSLLKTANYESVNYRYKEATPCEAYHWNPNGILPYIGGRVISWGQVLQAVRCYEYQSCEAPTWETSLAKAVCGAIRLKVCGIIADEAGAEWEWRREHAEEIMNTIREGLKS
jgi:hypothetical protein